MLRFAKAQKKVAKKKTERQYRDYVLKKLKEAKIKVISISDKWRSGTPDLLIIYKGRHVFLELKKKDGLVSEIQKAEHEQIKKNGGECYVLEDTKIDINKMISNIKQGEKDLTWNQQ